MIKLKIDVKKIDKRHLFEGAKGTYLDLALIENKEGEDQYGNAGFIVQQVSKEAFQAGEKGPIVGNFRHYETKSDGGNGRGGRDVSASEAMRKMHGGEKRTTRDNSAVEPDDCDEIPFAPKPAIFQP